MIEVLQARALSLQGDLTSAGATLAEAQDLALVTSEAGDAIRAELDRLALICGASGVTGPGLVVTIDDASIDRDGDTNLAPEVTVTAVAPTRSPNTRSVPASPAGGSARMWGPPTRHA